MIEPFVIRQRLFRALGVPSSLCDILHAWAIVENRAFCHELMADHLCLGGSEKARRIQMARKLDALAHFSKTAGYDLGKINRKPITTYGSFNLNACVSFIQERLAAKSDVRNIFVEIDTLAPEAISRFLPHIPQSTEKAKPNRRQKSKLSAYDSNTLGLTFEALVSREFCTVVDALRLAKSGFYVFPVHSTVKGFCSCRWGRQCKKAGKHPCVANWQQLATRFEDSIIRLWGQFPDANVGVACGRQLPRGGYLVVIDCDVRHFGHGSISHLERNELCPLPPTFELTAGGGPHRYYSYPRVFHSGPGTLGAGVDLQSKGRYVVAAGVHARGTRYTVTADLPIARLPDQWANYIDAVQKKALPLIGEGSRTNTLMRWCGGLIGSGANAELALATLRDYRNRRIENGARDFPDEKLKEMIGYCIKQERQKEGRAAA